MKVRRHGRVEKVGDSMTNTEKRAILDKHFSDYILNDGPEFDEDLYNRYNLWDATGFCGCGIPGESAEWLRQLLMALDRPTNDWNKKTAQVKEILEPLPEAVRYLILYWIDDRGWTEHGSSIIGSWLTEKGTAAILALDVLIKGMEEGA